MILSLITTIVLSEFASMIEADAILKDQLDLSKTIYLADVGRHVVVHDACEANGRLYVAGGATSPSSFGGMDAVIFVYENHTLIETIFRGGYYDDQFYGIHCGRSLWVSGYSNSPDFLDDSRIQNFGKAFILELNYQGEERQRFVSTYGFESHLLAMDGDEDSIVAVGYAQRVTQSDLYIVQFRDNQFHEIIHPLSGYDRLVDVEMNQTITAVGYSNSSEIGANGMRGILVDINEYSIDIEVYKSSSDSRFTSIESGVVLGSMNNQGIVYHPVNHQTVTYPTFEEIVNHSPSVIGTAKGHSLLDEKKLPGRFIVRVGNTYIFQEEGMLHKAYLYVPYLLERHATEIRLNQQLLTDEVIDVMTTSLTTQLTWKLVSDDIEVITRVVHHPNTAFCNIDSEVYYHPVTVLCNQLVVLDGKLIESTIILDEPKVYELELNEQLIRFEIKEPIQPVIQVNPPIARLPVTTSQNNWWMIPAGWVGLFFLKKLQD